MRDSTGRRPQQRTLAFAHFELWQQLPDPDRLRCRALCGQLLRAVLHAEALPRSDDDRQDPSRPS
jgi:hypothetical protein